MEWRKSYLDVVLIPLALLLPFVYHCWLWHMVRTRPRRTVIAINSAGRRRWVHSIMKDNDKKNILAVQTIRNTLMGSTLMATTSILLCSGLAALISSTYSVKKPLANSAFGARGDFMTALKYVTLLVLFLSAFACYSLSIRFLNQFNFLVNVPYFDAGRSGDNDEGEKGDVSSLVTVDYVCHLLEKGWLLNSVGNRLFYAALPLLLWIFGPVLVFLTSVAMIPVLYNLDMVDVNGEGVKEKVTTKGTRKLNVGKDFHAAAV